MDGARRGLEEGGLFVGELVDLVDLGLVAATKWAFQRLVTAYAARPQPFFFCDSLGDVLCETTRDGHSLRLKVLTEQALSATTEEAVATGDGDVGDASIAHLESLDVFAHLDDLAHGFVAWDELRKWGCRGGFQHQRKEINREYGLRRG
jgi:hypothetical protein